MHHAIRWLRFSGRDRIVVNVTDDAEAAGADRLYQWFGWQLFAREI